MERDGLKVQTRWFSLLKISLKKKLEDSSPQKEAATLHNSVILRKIILGCQSLISLQKVSDSLTLIFQLEQSTFRRIVKQIRHFLSNHTSVNNTFATSALAKTQLRVNVSTVRSVKTMTYAKCAFWEAYTLNMRCLKCFPFDAQILLPWLLRTKE